MWRAPVIRLVVGALVAVALAGCGGSNPRMLSESQSERLLASVESIEAAVADGECTRALARVASFQTQVNTLPPTVAERLRDRLRQGANHLAQRVPTDCRGDEATPTPTGTPTATPTPTPTETPAPTPTPTPTEEAEPEEPEQPEEPEEPEVEGEAEESDNGKGKGKGNGEGKG